MDFKKETKTRWIVKKFKAQLVAKDFRQWDNIVLFDTFSHVTRITSIRMIVSRTYIYNLEVHRININIIVLNVYLEEKIYMEHYEGFYGSWAKN